MGKTDDVDIGRVELQRRFQGGGTGAVAGDMQDGGRPFAGLGNQRAGEVGEDEAVLAVGAIGKDELTAGPVQDPGEAICGFHKNIGFMVAWKSRNLRNTVVSNSAGTGSALLIQA